MNARYYSPQLGRFISPDPLVVHGLAPGSPYEYASGNPIGNVDPTGLWGIPLVAVDVVMGLAGASDGDGLLLAASGLLDASASLAASEAAEQATAASAANVKSQILRLIQPTAAPANRPTAPQVSPPEVREAPPVRYAENIIRIARPFGPEPEIRPGPTFLNNHSGQDPYTLPVDHSSHTAQTEFEEFVFGTAFETIPLIGRYEAPVVTGGAVAPEGASIFGPNTVGAAQRVPAQVLQSGGNTISRATAKALGLTKEQANRAMHAMKPAEGIPARMVGKIMDNGDYVDPHTGEVLGNLYDYVMSDIDKGE
jgi:hypothetical protein